jgi:hypothetical protein|tara:strand:+ start:1264 stop:1485 length:222 start_codon:yes stop_codon:yes gene_type:complete
MCDATGDCEEPATNSIDPAVSPKVSPVDIVTPPETPPSESPVVTEILPLEDDDDTDLVERLIDPLDIVSLSPD